VPERAEDDADDVDARAAEHHGDHRLISGPVMSPSPSRHRPARLGARALGGVAVAVALAMAGCGGDSGGSSAPTTAAAAPARTATTSGALTHAQLVAQADAACAKASDAIGAIPVARSLSALAEYAAAVRRVGQDLREQLGALKPGADDQAAYATYLDGIDASNAALDAMRTAAQGGDARAVRAAAATIDKTAVGVLATRAGLPGCAATAPGGAAS
jgi:soluble cytochrome b562